MKKKIVRPEFIGLTRAKEIGDAHFCYRRERRDALSWPCIKRTTCTRSLMTEFCIGYEKFVARSVRINEALTLA